MKRLIIILSVLISVAIPCGHQNVSVSMNPANIPRLLVTFVDHIDASVYIYPCTLRVEDYGISR